MGIGLGIFLLVVGAIFTFTNVDSSVLNLGSSTGNTIGIILMVAGALAIILGLIMNAQRTRTQHTMVTERRGAPEVVERRVDADDVVERRVERRDDGY
jgi:cytochrome c biogenesis protein CcdA